MTTASLAAPVEVPARLLRAHVPICTPVGLEGDVRHLVVRSRDEPFGVGQEPGARTVPLEGHLDRDLAAAGKRDPMARALRHAVASGLNARGHRDVDGPHRVIPGATGQKHATPRRAANPVWPCGDRRRRSALPAQQPDDQRQHYKPERPHPESPKRRITEWVKCSALGEPSPCPWHTRGAAVRQPRCDAHGRARLAPAASQRLPRVGGPSQIAVTAVTLLCWTRFLA